MEENKLSTKSLAAGAAIGAAIMLTICAIVFGFFYSRIKEKEIQYENVSSIDEHQQKKDIGLIQKMSILTDLLDKYYLYDYDKNKTADAIYKAIMQSTGDPYTTYYTAEEYKEISEGTIGIFSGLGVAVQQLTTTGEVKVNSIYDESPAMKGGLKVEDIIIAVDGESCEGKTLSEVVAKMRGENGTSVNLTVLRAGERLELTFIRGEIKEETVIYNVTDDNIGYIRIVEFNEVAVEQYNKALDELFAKKVKGIVFDIRSNPGGLLTSVTKMLDRILPEGTIVYTQDKNGKRVYQTSDANTDLNVPCAVLVNGKSASASEIFAGAIKDYGVGRIIGTQTFGKGIVQSVIGLTDGSAVKITVEDYFTPKGNNIHKIGITPDQIIEFDGDAYANDGTDNQIEAAYDYINQNIK